MNPLVIGVDGGGTHTRARIANPRGETLGAGEAGAGNPQANGVESARREILDAIRRACAEARVEHRAIGAACLGIAGVARPDERAEWSTWALESIAPRAAILNDGEIVIAAGTPENWGVALIAGTGSSAWGKARDGRLARAGGWGWLIGDEGSGFELARLALRAASQASDGRGEPTRLLDAILQYWGLNSAMDLIPRVYRSGLAPADIAQLAPLVIRTAEEGDSLAQELVERAAAALADTAIAVARQLQIREEKIPLALTGGLLLETEVLRSVLLAELKARADYFAPIAQVLEPVVGAVRIAVELMKQ